MMRRLTRSSAGWASRSRTIVTTNLRPDAPAALQAAQGCARPTLIRVETAGSHGYRPTDRIIAEVADLWAFALANLTTGTHSTPMK